MTARALPASAYLTLKGAFRRLVARVGGVEAAAALTRVSKSRIAEYGAPDGPTFPPADVIADLESDIADPMVTRELAGLLGCTLLCAQSGAAPLDAQQGLRRLTAELGDLARDLDRALQDGRLSPNERDRLVADARDIEEAARLLVTAVMRPANQPTLRGSSSEQSSNPPVPEALAQPP